MNQFVILTYAEEGAKAELKRRMETAIKHDLYPDYIRGVEITLKNLAEIREKKEIERRNV